MPVRLMEGKVSHANSEEYPVELLELGRLGCRSVKTAVPRGGVMAP
jgi:hypothetical protein